MSNEKREFSGKIHGICPSKANTYRVIIINGHGSLGKTQALKKYEESFLWQVGSIRDANIEGLFEYYVDVFYPSKRSDLDNAIKVQLDLLQKAKVIKNDNNCCKIVARKFIDKDNPRIEFTIKEV